MNRTIARAEISRLLDLDFHRIIASHGHIVESDGPAKLLAAFSWLGMSSRPADLESLHVEP